MLFILSVAMPYPLDDSNTDEIKRTVTQPVMRPPGEVKTVRIKS